jgi:hypothetical protein
MQATASSRSLLHDRTDVTFSDPDEVSSQLSNLRVPHTLDELRVMFGDRYIENVLHECQARLAGDMNSVNIMRDSVKTVKNASSLDAIILSSRATPPPHPATGERKFPDESGKGEVMSSTSTSFPNGAADRDSVDHDKAFSIPDVLSSTTDEWMSATATVRRGNMATKISPINSSGSCSGKVSGIRKASTAESQAPTDEAAPEDEGHAAVSVASIDDDLSAAGLKID